MSTFNLLTFKDHNSGSILLLADTTNMYKQPS